MPTRKACGFCKVCEQQNVPFEYWETASNIDPYRTNYEQKLAKAFICSKCREDLEKLLKTQGSEICSECWSNVNYQNFDTTNFTKPIGEKCPHCEQKQGTQIKPNNCINCQKVISQEPTEHLCSNCKSSESNPVDTPKTSSQSTSNSNHYTSPPTTNPTSTLTNCCECHKAIAVGEQVYTWPHLPNKTFCASCGQQQETCFNYLQQIMQGIDCFPQIEQDNRLSYENKVNLTAAIGIKRGERINIDNLSLSEEDKQGLRDFQKQCSSPLSFDYTIKCKDCGKEEKSAFIWLKGTPCQHCHSLNVETWKDGKLYSSKSPQATKDPRNVWIPVLGVILFVLVSSALFWKKIFPKLKVWWKTKKLTKEDQTKHS